MPLTNLQGRKHYEKDMLFIIIHLMSADLTFGGDSDYSFDTPPVEPSIHFGGWLPEALPLSILQSPSPFITIPILLLVSNHQRMVRNTHILDWGRVKKMSEKLVLRGPTI